MIVFLSSWLLQSKALSSDNVNPSTGQPDLKKNELFSTHDVVYDIHIFCMVVLWRVKRKKLQTNWKSIKIACGAVSASHRQLRAYSPLESVKVKVKTDNNYVDVSGSTQHEIYRWVVHIYPRIYQVIIMNFREYCLLFLIFCSTETQKRTNRGNFFVNFLEPVLIVSVITLIWGAWHFCMLSFLVLIFPWQKRTLMQIFMLFACLLLHSPYSPIIAIICLCTCSLFTCFNIPGDHNRIFVDLPVSVWTLVILAYRSPGTARLRDQYENKDMVELALKNISLKIW